jgi:hypothetical protein
LYRKDPLVASFFPESEYELYIYRKKTPRTNATKQKYYDPKDGDVCFVPRNGVLETLTQKVYRYKNGRKLVFFRDTMAARIFGRMLEKVQSKNSTAREFNDITNLFEISKGSSKPKIQSSMDLMFNTSNDLFKNQMQKINNKNDRVDDIVKVLIKTYRYRNRHANGKKIRNFVVATPSNGSEKMVSLVSNVMNGDIQIRRFAEVYVDSVIRANDPENQTLVADAKILKEEMEMFNLHGDRLELLIIGGGGMYQGLNIDALRHVYIPDESHIPKHIKQVLGRASRGFGHMKLPENKRKVCVHMFNPRLPSIVKIINTSQHENTTIDRVKKKISKLFYIGHTNPVLQDITTAVVAGIIFLYHHQHTLNNTSITHGNTLTINTTLKAYRERYPPYKTAAEQLKQLKKIANTQRNNR